MVNKVCYANEKGTGGRREMAVYEKEFKGSWQEIVPKIFRAAELIADPVKQVDKECQGIVVNVAVFEKYYFRVNSAASLSITTISDGQVVKVVIIAAGGGEGIFNLDWGSAESFLEKYLRKLRELLPESVVIKSDKRIIFLKQWKEGDFEERKLSSKCLFYF